MAELNQTEKNRIVELQRKPNTEKTAEEVKELEALVQKRDKP